MELSLGCSNAGMAMVLGSVSLVFFGKVGVVLAVSRASVTRRPNFQSEMWQLQSWAFFAGA